MILYINIPRTIFFASRSEESLSSLFSFAFSLEKYSPGKRGEVGKKMKSTRGNAGKPRGNFHPIGEFGNIGRERSSGPALVLLRHGMRVPGVCAAGAVADDAGGICCGGLCAGGRMREGLPIMGTVPEQWRRICGLSEFVPMIPELCAVGPENSGGIAWNGNGTLFYTILRINETVRRSGKMFYSSVD